MERFRDRREAGRELGRRLAESSFEDPVVLGLPRGGVPVAADVADALGAPLDVLVVRKLGVPGHEELAMGAVGEAGAIALNHSTIASLGISEDRLRAAELRERAEVEARVERFRKGREPVPLEGRTAIIVDDGIATGSTARTACRIARARGAARVVLAAPVAARDSLAEILEAGDADEVVCLSAPRSFMAVGMHYLDFRQTSDEEVVELLAARR